MNVAYVLLSVLLGVSTIMTIAMGVAWFHFGRQKHVLTWTASYAVSIVQWMTDGAGYYLNSRLWLIFTNVGLIITASLLALGIRQRSGRPTHILMVGIAAAAVTVALSPLIDPRMQDITVLAYTSIVLAISAVSLWPRGRSFTAPKMAFFGILTLDAISQAVLAIATFIVPAPRASDHLPQLITAVLWTTIFVGTGVAAVLVVAGDLAEKLRRQAGHDPMTDILNRRGLEEAAVRAIANAQRYDRPLSIVVCDLDGFKVLNDTHGHIAGDAALCAFAQLLVATMRRGDVVGRMGGDEFGILLIDTVAQDAADVIERVRRETHALSLGHVPGGQLRASFGIAQMEPGDMHLNDLVKRADAALYTAKNAGRDQVSVWRAVA